MTVAAPTTPGQLLPPAAPAGPAVAQAPARRACRRSRCCACGPPSSAVEDFTDERASQPVLADPDGPDPAASTRVVLTRRQGLLRPAGRAPQGRATRRVALVRVEQLYPLPGEEIADALAAYPSATRRRVGARRSRPTRARGRTSRCRCPSTCPRAATLRRVSRKAAASPAAGSSKVHEAEQAALIAARPRAGRRVLHRPGPRGAGRAARRGAGDASPGSPSGCASSSTSTPSSRSRSSGWPPGWPASTTTTSSRVDLR